ncbi:hypothetical protein BDU57DRAFT_510343 [Ampelomyces quisqualis]|uniref:Uncharacterized protein n=1 Tax=Ampelomyces quisqualis TaxID=50730 RepID=A0A6A5R2W7_AMPQU|nr:hypothetical protein BDU57DRAFT_510343 [Ampelomyces quisqualis]
MRRHAKPGARTARRGATTSSLSCLQATSPPRPPPSPVHHTFPFPSPQLPPQRRRHPEKTPLVGKTHACCIRR